MRTALEIGDSSPTIDSILSLEIVCLNSAKTPVSLSLSQGLSLSLSLSLSLRSMLYDDT